MAKLAPIFCATHPRACSTAFERVFMTRSDLTCLHEPFGDAFFYGPERLSTRYENDEQLRQDSGSAQVTFRDVWDVIEDQARPGKRIFIKELVHHIMPPDGATARPAPSFLSGRYGLDRLKIPEGTGNDLNNCQLDDDEIDNPTVIPKELLMRFRFTFLIRDPHESIPSFYRCTVPPLSHVTKFEGFRPSEAAYAEVRKLFDYVQKLTRAASNAADATATVNQAERQQGSDAEADALTQGICLIDAQDLLSNPEAILRQYCDYVGIEYRPQMLAWTIEDRKRAEKAFAKWEGFHDDAIHSDTLRTNKVVTTKTEKEWDAEWTARYGEEGAKVIRDTVDQNMKHYLYLKQFVIKP